MEPAEHRAELVRAIVEALGTSDVKVAGGGLHETFIVRLVFPQSTKDARATHHVDTDTVSRGQEALREIGWRRDEVMLRAMEADPSLGVPFSFPSQNGFRPFSEVAAAVVSLHLDVLRDEPASIEITRE